MADITLRLVFMYIFGILFLGNWNVQVNAQCTSLTAYDNEGTIESHYGYGSYDYSSNIDACWIIQTDSYSKSVKLYTDDFDLEGEDTCAYDFLKLYDGNSDSYSVDYVSYCGTGSFDIVSSGRYMYILFETDGSVTGEGFRLKYKQVDSSNYDSSDWDNRAHRLYSGLRWWGILLIVLGVIVFLIILIIVIVVVVVVCILNANKKRGRVMDSNARPGGRIVAQTGHASYSHRTGAVMVQPPPYGYPSVKPPNYSAGHYQGPAAHQGYGTTVPQQQHNPSFPQQLAVHQPQQTQQAQQHQAVQQQQQQPPPPPQMNYGSNDDEVPPPPVYTDPATQ